VARVLGMNSKKLPRLRPSPQQLWKLPVGASIEECYRKRFGGGPESEGPRWAKGESSSHPDDALKMDCARRSQVEDLICYVANLVGDLECWLVHGKIAHEVLAQVRREFREIADAVEAGASIPQMPGIPVPPAPRLALRSSRIRTAATRALLTHERHGCRLAVAAALDPSEALHREF